MPWKGPQPSATARRCASSWPERGAAASPPRPPAMNVLDAWFARVAHEPRMRRDVSR